MHVMDNWYKSRPKRYVGCFLSKMLSWMWTFYNELRSILLVGEIERVQWEATNSEELQMTNQVESFDYFLDEGRKYLNMARDLHKFTEKSSKLFPRVLKALDAYTRLNAFCNSTKLWDIDYVPLRRYMYIIEELLKSEHEYEKIVENEEERDEEINQDENKYNERIVKEENKHIREIRVKKIDYNEIMGYEDVIFMFREQEEKGSDEYDDCYANNLLATDYRIVIFLRQLMSIKTLVAQLQDLYAVFSRRRLSLYILLTDYCLKADSFLCRNAQFRNSRRFRRGRQRNTRQKYRQLEQLLAHIIQERQYMTKYIETASDYRCPEANAT